MIVLSGASPWWQLEHHWEDLSLKQAAAAPDAAAVPSDSAVAEPRETTLAPETWVRFSLICCIKSLAAVSR